MYITLCIPACIYVDTQQQNTGLKRICILNCKIYCKNIFQNKNNFFHKGPLLPHLFQSLVLPIILIHANLSSSDIYLILICISLTINEVMSLFICLLLFKISSSEKWLFISLPCSLSCGIYLFLTDLQGMLYMIKNTSPQSGICLTLFRVLDNDESV